MPTRTSTRQAAVKANEALHEDAHTKPRRASGGAKRKASQQETTNTKKGKKQDESPQENQLEESNADKNGVNGEAKDPGLEEKANAKVPETKYKPLEEAKADKKLSEGPAVEESKERKEALPSNILEKGIIYFFFRGRVGIDEPEDVEEVARSFIVLRPLPHGATLTEGPIGDNENCRLLMLPKKVLPTSARDRYMGFVEKAGTSVKTLRESFEGSEYETKTRGHSHVPAATPFAEGVYAISSTTRTSHLAYILTIPSEVSEVQHDLGLKNRGSFIMSAKNPKYPGPPTARIPKSPDYPQKVFDDFRDLRWVPLQPQFIDYPNAQFLIIGEAQEQLGKGGATEEKDQEQGKPEAAEEIEALEHENEVRAYPLRGDDTVFEDLGMDINHYPKVPTTWQ